MVWLRYVFVVAILLPYLLNKAIREFSGQQYVRMLLYKCLCLKQVATVVECISLMQCSQFLKNRMRL